MTGIRKLLPRRKRIWVLWIIAAFFTFLLVSCGPVKLTLAQANNKPKGVVASPALISATTTLQEWNDKISPELLIGLQEYVYGYMPDSQTTHLQNKRNVSTSAFNGTARIDEYKVEATAIFNDVSSTTPSFNMVLVSPADATGPVPVILMHLLPNPYNRPG